MNTGKIVLGIVASLAVGVTAGILIAPDRGSATRKRIYKKGHSYVGSWKAQVHTVLETVTEKLDLVKAGIHQLTENTKANQATDGVPTVNR